jgi:hypothetical protein
LFGQLQPYRGKAHKVATELMALIKAADDEVTVSKQTEHMEKSNG